MSERWKFRNIKDTFNEKYARMKSFNGIFHLKHASMAIQHTQTNQYL